MALSGNFLTSGWYSSSTNDTIYVKFSFTATQSIVGNYTDVAWQIAGSRSKDGYITSGGFRVIINGDTVLSTAGRINMYNGTVVATGTKRIYHDASGNASFSVSVEAGIYWNWQLSGAPTVSGTGAFTLDRIPRSATITTAPNFNDEQSPTITYSNPAGNAVTALDACISLTGAKDDIQYRAIPKTGTSYTFSLTEAERAILRNGTQGGNSRTVIFFVRTNINGTIYHSTLYRTLTIVNAAPTLDPVIRDTNGDITALTGGDALVRYFSNVYFETGAQALKGATITSQSVTCGGVTVEGATGTIDGVLSGDFVFTVTDSRGNTATLPVQVPFVEYVTLTCSIGNNKPDTDGDFTLTASGACYVGDIAAAGSNDLYVLYRYKESGGDFSDWMEMSVTSADNHYTATVKFTGLNYRRTYIFQCKAGDLVTTATTDEVAIKSLPVFDWSGEDFNFNVPVAMPSLTLDGSAMVDFPVDEGASGIWTYRLWNSGIAECWGTVAPKSFSISTAWGSIFILDNAIPQQSYPFTFTVDPVVSMTLHNTTGNCWYFTGTPGGVSKTPAFGLARGASGSVTVGARIKAIGRWK